MSETQARALDAFARGRLDALEAAGLRRTLRPLSRAAGAVCVRDGVRQVSFCDNDYLGLACDPRVIEAGVDGARRCGAGAGASRLVTGDSPEAHDLERAIAAAKKMPAARLFSSGYMTNVGVIPVLAGRGDVIVMDELAHSCMHAGARLSGAEIRLYPHNDVGAAARMLADRSAQARALLVTETVFSMDGDRAPLEALASACDAAGALMMTDDAHGFGWLADHNPAPVQMGTLSKSAGVLGGYVCAGEAFIDLLSSRARSLVYTTGLPPFVISAARMSIDIMTRETWRGERALALAHRFCAAMGWPEPHSPIVPFILGDPARALSVAAALEARGFIVTAIRPPTVPEGASRLRFTFSAAHTDADVENLVEAVRSSLASTGDGAP